MAGWENSAHRVAAAGPETRSWAQAAHHAACSMYAGTLPSEAHVAAEVAGAMSPPFPSVSPFHNQHGISHASIRQSDAAIRKHRCAYTQE